VIPLHVRVIVLVLISLILSFHPSFPIFIFFYCCLPHLDLHSFPTRRSSDLYNSIFLKLNILYIIARTPMRIIFSFLIYFTPLSRSEEHTSELQSRFDLVCRLLLEKKKHALARYTPIIKFRVNNTTGERLTSG